MPIGYDDVLTRLKNEVRTARMSAQRAANAELLRLYRTIGQTILEQQAVAGWGGKIIDRLSADLRREFPGMSGLARSNLYYMRAFAAAWPDGEVVPRSVGQLPWRMIRCLLDKLADRGERDWYADKAVENAWSLPVLEHHIATGLRSRLGSAPSNFEDHLPAADSDLAQEMTKDPYVFDFLPTTEQAAERDLEQAMMDRLQETLMEFGHGYAFVGRQVRFDVGGDEFVVDMLLFNTSQLRFIVFELKTVAAQPEHIGKLNFYVNAVDDLLRRPEHGDSSTIGILLAADRDDVAVQYALRGLTTPLAISTYTTYRALPDDIRPALPSIDDLTEIVREVRDEV